MDKRRTLFWLVFLGGAAVLAILPEYFGSEPEVVEPVVQRRAPTELRVAVVDTAAADPAANPAGRGTAPTADLFGAHSWYVAPPAPPPSARVAAPSAPVAPSAPAMPFQFLGKLDDGDTLRVFLQRGERIHTVTVGDVIDGTYRVERIAGTQMTLVYIPLNIAQTLSVGSNL